MGECVRASERFSRDMDNFQHEVGKANNPVGLSMVESLRNAEVH